MTTEELSIEEQRRLLLESINDSAQYADPMNANKASIPFVHGILLDMSHGTNNHKGKLLTSRSVRIMITNIEASIKSIRDGKNEALKSCVLDDNSLIIPREVDVKVDQETTKAPSVDYSDKVVIENGDDLYVFGNDGPSIWIGAPVKIIGLWLKPNKEKSKFSISCADILIHPLSNSLKSNGKVPIMSAAIPNGNSISFQELAHVSVTSAKIGLHRRLNNDHNVIVFVPGNNTYITEKTERILDNKLIVEYHENVKIPPISGMILDQKWEHTIHPSYPTLGLFDLVFKSKSEDGKQEIKRVGLSSTLHSIERDRSQGITHTTKVKVSLFSPSKRKQTNGSEFIGCGGPYHYLYITNRVVWESVVKLNRPDLCLYLSAKATESREVETGMLYKYTASGNIVGNVTAYLENYGLRVNPLHYNRLEHMLNDIYIMCNDVGSDQSSRFSFHNPKSDPSHEIQMNYLKEFQLLNPLNQSPDVGLVNMIETTRSKKEIIKLSNVVIRVLIGKADVTKEVPEQMDDKKAFGNMSVLDIIRHCGKGDLPDLKLYFYSHLIFWAIYLCVLDENKSVKAYQSKKKEFMTKAKELVNAQMKEDYEKAFGDKKCPYSAEALLDLKYLFGDCLFVPYAIVGPRKRKTEGESESTKKK